MKRSEAEIAMFLEHRAGEMRHKPTPSEDMLWPYLRELGFHRQVPIQGRTKNQGRWNYVLDFLEPIKRLCIEVDGSAHRLRKGRDRRRDMRLSIEGYRTIRIPNNRALKETTAVIEEIKQEMER